MCGPGTDGALALGILRLLIKEKQYDANYVAKHVNGFKELAEACESYTPDKVARITWVSEEKLKETAQDIRRQSKGTIVWLGGALSRYTNSIQTVRAIIALQAITGNLSGPGKGLMNVQGGKPGGGDEFEERYRAKDLEAGLSFRKVLYNMERSKVKVLLLNSSYRRYPDADRVRKAIGKVEFVVYRGFFMDEEAKLAHLIIPATMVFESAGFPVWERNDRWSGEKRQSRDPGETVEDWRFYRDLGRRLNKDTFPQVESAEDIYELFRQHAPSWVGLTLDRLKKDPSGISWPCPSANHPGTKGTLYPGDRFLTRDGKVELRSDVLGSAWLDGTGGKPGGRSGKGQDLSFDLSSGKSRSALAAHLYKLVCLHGPVLGRQLCPGSPGNSQDPRDPGRR